MEWKKSHFFEEEKETNEMIKKKRLRQVAK